MTTNGEDDAIDSDRTHETPGRLADDGFYGALAARPRRRLLAHLLEQGESPVDELVDVLCGWATADEPMVPPDEREQIHAALYHVHLPRLSDAGLVAYDREEGSVEVADLSPTARELIRRSVEAERE